MCAAGTHDDALLSERLAIVLTIAASPCMTRFHIPCCGSSYA